jgi:hypothetical protein
MLQFIHRNRNTAKISKENIMWTENAKNVGEFQEKDHHRHFTYRPTTDAWALQNNLTHEIDVLDGFRFARILKTVAYVAVDEAADGSPVIEKWSLAYNNVYQR